MSQENDTRPDGRELGEFRQTILNVGQCLLRRHDNDNDAVQVKLCMQHKICSS